MKTKNSVKIIFKVHNCLIQLVSHKLINMKKYELGKS